MKKIHTPISSSIGNHEMKICISIDCSSSGLVDTLTPYFIRSPTIQMSYRPGELTTICFFSCVVARMVRPWISTLVIWPCFAASMNSEYSMGMARVSWRALNWLNTVISTSPMTSQMTRFLSILFNALLLFCRTASKIHLTGRSDPAPARKSRPIHPVKRRVLRL